MSGSPGVLQEARVAPAGLADWLGAADITDKKLASALAVCEENEIDAYEVELCASA